ncbi:glycosyl hydrolase family 18 protein [Lentzea albida]|uniref:chitinase n=1 Tax=Lentzea albida TaxID=65499 RepID=A0A1H9T9R0_9PSEU|nr:glycosyl hydrolase family 18 protein [Lentzea albida]SER93856.1 chitinase [Lentzea albida]
MSKFRWHLAALFAAVAAMVLGIVVVPAASGAGGVSATFSKGSDWGTGFEGKYTITNNSTAALTSWTVEFTLPANHRVTSLWDGSYTTSGQTVTVKNTWNGNIGVGGSVSFGFNGAYSGTFGAPTNCKLNGGSCEAGGTNPTTTTTTSTTTSTTTTTTTTTTTGPPPPPGKINLGYFAEWGVYPARNYQVKNIDTSGSASKLTHINYSFGNVVGGKCTIGETFPAIEKSMTAAESVDGVADTWDAPVRGNFNQLLKLKKKYPHLKVLYSFGGWTWSGGFGEASRNLPAFVDSCYNLLKDPRWAGLFDGIDIDWEYPNACGLSCDTSGPAAFANMAQALRNKFGQNFLVTAAITADGSAGGKIDAADYGPASQYLNWYNVMTYDYFGAWAAQGPTAPHSPLTSYNGIPTAGFNSEAAISKLRSKGVPASKLLLGIGFYGRGWTGVTQAAPGGTATGPAPGTFEPGIEDYKVLKTKCPATGTIAGTAYAFCNGQWWSYDTPQTITSKIQWARSQGLGGAFFWELTGDTANGELITAMKNALG